MNILLLIISFLVGVCLTFILMTTQISTTDIDIKLTLNIGSLIFSVVTCLIAFFALNTWRTQIKYKSIYDVALQLEKSLLQFCISIVNESKDIDKAELKKEYKLLTDSKFILIQREFEAPLIRKIEKEVRLAIEELKNNGYVSKEVHAKLSDSMNTFTKKVNKVFT